MIKHQEEQSRENVRESEQPSTAVDDRLLRLENADVRLSNVMIGKHFPEMAKSNSNKAFEGGLAERAYSEKFSGIFIRFITWMEARQWSIVPNNNAKTIWTEYFDPVFVEG